jgi:hypothetical protein
MKLTLLVVTTAALLTTGLVAGAIVARQHVQLIIAITPKAVVASDTDYEVVSAVAQGGHCDGRVLATESWSDEYYGSTKLGGPFLAAPGRRDYQYHVPELTPSGQVRPAPTPEWKGDPQIAALPNGDLVMAKMLFVGGRPDPALARTPDEERKSRSTYVHHSIYQFVVSKDCGQSWQAYPSLDASKAFNKACAIPYLAGGHRGQPPLHLQDAGFDRGELTADPWTGTLFFNTTCDTATLNADGVQDSHLEGGAVFRLLPGAASWQPLQLIKRWTPRIMTTTADGSLWMLQCTGTPTLPYLSRMPGAAKKGTLPQFGDEGEPVDVSDAKFPAGAGRNPCAKETVDYPNYDKKHPNGTRPGFSISRATANSVRIAYPRAEADGRVGIVTSLVTEGSTSASFVVSDTKILEPKPGWSAFLPTFVQRTDPELAQNAANVALLYWYESNSDASMLTVRYSILRGTTDYTAPHTLSNPFARKTNVLGDYMNGGYACLDGDTTFFPTWIQSGADGSNNITVARVNAQVDCTPPTLSLPLVELKTSVPTGQTPAPGGVALPPASGLPSGVIKVPTVPVLVPSIPIVVPPVQPTETTPSLPSLPAPLFTVLSVSLSMETCQLNPNADAPLEAKEVCLGAYSITVAPGAKEGGYIFLELDGSVTYSCDGDTEPFHKDLPPAEVHANEPKILGSIELDFPQPPNPAEVFGAPGTPSTAQLVLTDPMASSPVVDFFSDETCLKE